MKAARLLIASPVLLGLGLVAAFQSFQGHTLFGLGYPLARNWIDVSVKAAGGWVVVGLVLMLGSVIVYVCGVIGVLRSRARSVTAAR